MIYLDHHAATPLSPAVREAMARAHVSAWANASSVHAAGRAARGLLEGARRELATALGAQAADIVLTGGATEAELRAHGPDWLVGNLGRLSAAEVCGRVTA